MCECVYGVAEVDHLVAMLSLNWEKSAFISPSIVTTDDNLWQWVVASCSRSMNTVGKALKLHASSTRCIRHDTLIIITVWECRSLCRYRSSYSCRYFVLPCCFFDFYGKYQRRQCKKSQYKEYIDFINEVSQVSGFNTEEDCLRIPSTKRVGWHTQGWPT